MNRYVALLITLLLPLTVQAEIIGQSVRYTHEGEAFEGYLAFNEALGADQPAVIIIHDWDGLGEYEKTRARMLARQGYAAFAVDLFGEGIRPESIDQRRALTGALYADRTRMRALLEAGLDAAGSHDAVDPANAVTIGYCFGGAAALEWARAGGDLAGFVSFHGGLGTPDGQDYRQTSAPVLILHGSNDSVAPMSDVAALATQLDADAVDYRMEIYGGARHAFTDWDNAERYDPAADLQSWQTLGDFLGQTLGR